VGPDEIPCNLTGGARNHSKCRKQRASQATGLQALGHQSKRFLVRHVGAEGEEDQG